MNNNEFELVIKKNELGIIVYEATSMNRIDAFPNTQEGYERLMNFIQEQLIKNVFI